MHPESPREDYFAKEIADLIEDEWEPVNSGSTEMNVKCGGMNLNTPLARLETYGSQIGQWYDCCVFSLWRVPIVSKQFCVAATSKT